MNYFIIKGNRPIFNRVILLVVESLRYPKRNIYVESWLFSTVNGYLVKCSFAILVIFTPNGCEIFICVKEGNKLYLGMKLFSLMTQSCHPYCPLSEDNQEYLNYQQKHITINRDRIKEVFGQITVYIFWFHFLSEQINERRSHSQKPRMTWFQTLFLNGKCTTIQKMLRTWDKRLKRNMHPYD